MSHCIRKLSALTALITATPALANAQGVAYTTKSPVALTSFAVDKSFESGMIGGELEVAPQFIPDGITLKFVNQSKLTATVVTFVVTEGTSSQSIVDRGTFSSGVQIKHSFAVSGDMSALADATCRITEVDFVDGSVWHIARADVANR
jgi:hypothetical protein